MRTTTIFGLSFAGIVLYTLFAKGTAAANLYIYPTSVKNLRIENGGIIMMTIGLMINNTSNQKMVIRSMAGVVTANNYQVGYISSFSQSDILPNANTEIRIDLRLSPLGIVQDIIQAFNAGNFSQVIKVDAKINVDKYQIPVKLSYKIGAGA